ncbi:MAG: HAD family hydrolase [Armatimonadetes bacterium]|nr:HAD family hydrolase [Armatimonadota bacterium]
MLRAVFFDLDDTLLETHTGHAAAIRRAAETGAARHPNCPVARLEAAFHTAHSDLEPRLERRELQFDSQLAFRVRVWEVALEACTLPGAAAAELAEVYLEERARQHRLFPDALSGLAHFRARCPLVLVTNGLSDFQREKIARVNLAPHVDHIVVSEEVGFWKPDPGIFSHALSLVGVQPEEAVMVGDSLRHDIRGARNSGIRSVWMRRYPHLQPDPEIVPDAVVQDLRELADLLSDA